MSSRGLVGRPTARPSIGYRLVRSVCRLVGLRLFRVRASGLEHLPRDGDGHPVGGWICAGLPHRTWVEPLLLIALLPAQPRLAMIAEAAVVGGSWWRRLLVGRVGGVLATGPRGPAGPRGFDDHAAAVAGVLEAGMVLSVFPEVGPAARPPAVRRMSSGVAYFALRSDAPIVPVVFGGTDELFLRRPIEVRVLAPLVPNRGAGGEPTVPPVPGTPAERSVAGRLLAELRERVEAEVAAAHEAAQPASGTRRRWRWLTGPYPRAE